MSVTAKHPFSNGVVLAIIRTCVAQRERLGHQYHPGAAEWIASKVSPNITKEAAIDIIDKELDAAEIK